MSGWRLTVAALAVAAAGGCRTADVVRVAAADGSRDHRVFRVAGATRLMLEPALWQLEDGERINFDRPVTLYLKDPLPPEYDHVTLRMLHDGRSGLPDELLDPWCPADVWAVWSSALFGTDRTAKTEKRRNFLRRLADPRVVSRVKRGEPRPSAAGYALMMMAIEDELGESPEALLDRYVVKPYGLKDTAFALRPDLRGRLVKACAGSRPWLVPSGWEVDDHRLGDVKMATGGLLSSPSDLLKVCYVLLPHLDRMRGLLRERRLKNGRKAHYFADATHGGGIFVGFEPKGGHSVVVLENANRSQEEAGLELLEDLDNLQIRKRPAR